VEPLCQGDTSETEENVTVTRRDIFSNFDLCVSRKHMFGIFGPTSCPNCAPLVKIASLDPFIIYIYSVHNSILTQNQQHGQLEC
jgi:hypothetical protein